MGKLRPLIEHQHAFEHEFWRQRIRERCEARGYVVTAEYALADGGRVDLYATNGAKSFLIEIETGKSDVRRNIAKCQSHPGTLIVFCTSENASGNITELAGNNALVITPATIERLHDLLLRA